MAVERRRSPTRFSLQPLRAGPPLLRRVLHLPAGTLRRLPGPMRRRFDGGARRDPEDERGGDQLRWVRGLQYGGAV